MGKYRLICSLICFILMLSCENAPIKDVATKNKELMVKHKMEAKVLRHIVLIKFKKDATEEQMRLVERAFGELPLKIKEIRDFEWGINNSPEEINKGFTAEFTVEV